MAKRGKSKSRSAGKTSPEKRAGASGPALWRPVSGILLGGAALLVLAGLVSYQPRGAGDNWAGPVGHGLSATLLDTLGVGAYAAAIFLLLCASALVAERPRLSIGKTLAWGTVAFGTMALAALLVHAHVQGHLPGGVLGALLAGSLRGGLSTVGAALLLISGTAAALVVATHLWALRAAAAAGRISIAGGALAMRGAVRAVDLGARARGPVGRGRRRARRQRRRGLRGRRRARPLRSRRGRRAGRRRELQAQGAARQWRRADPARREGRAAPAGRGGRGAAGSPAPGRARIIEPPAAKKKKSVPAPPLAAALPGAPVASEAAPKNAAAPMSAKAEKPAAEMLGAAKEIAVKTAPAPVPEAASVKPASDAAHAPTIVEPRPPPKPTTPAKAEAGKVGAPSISTATLLPAVRASGLAPDGKVEEKRQFTLFGGRSAFTAPPIDVLTGESQGPLEIDRDALTGTAEKLRQTLASHGIQGQVTQIRPGPRGHHVRVPARGRRQGLAHLVALRRPRHGHEGAAGAHHRAHSRQGRGRASRSPTRTGRRWCSRSWSSRRRSRSRRASSPCAWARTSRACPTSSTSPRCRTC